MSATSIDGLCPPVTFGAALVRLGVQIVHVCPATASVKPRPPVAAIAQADVERILLECLGRLRVWSEFIRKGRALDGNRLRPIGRRVDRGHLIDFYSLQDVRAFVQDAQSELHSRFVKQASREVRLRASIAAAIPKVRPPFRPLRTYIERAVRISHSVRAAETRS